MRNKVMAAVVAGVLLVGAGVLTSVVSAPGTALAQEETDEGPLPRVMGFLSEVLDELVGEGAISSEDADAVLGAVESRVEEAKAERQAAREQLQGFLEDDVLTEDEASQLPEDHPLLGDRFDEAWADGELTREEIDEARPHRPRLRVKASIRALMDDGGIDQEEYDSLGDDHPLKGIDVSSYLEDGLITSDELRQIWQDFHTDSQDA